MDGDGYLEYLGRADDLINAQGYRVSPQEIEDVLVHHEAVQECACAEIAVRDDLSVVGAFIVAVPGTNPDAEDLKTYASDRLAAYKVPKEIVIVDALPHTATGKVQRNQLNALFASLKQA